jgi:hypothetical protein
LATTGEQISIQKRSQDTTTLTMPLVFTSGLSAPVSLPGSMISLRFRPLSPADAIAVIARGRPREDLGEVLANLSVTLGPGDAESLFPATPTGQTLLSVWTAHPISMMRYAALLLALTAAIEQSPQEA